MNHGNAMYHLWSTFYKRTISIWEIHSTKNWWSGIETKLCSIVRAIDFDHVQSGRLLWNDDKFLVRQRGTQCSELYWITYQLYQMGKCWNKLKGSNTIKLFLKALLQLMIFRKSLLKNLNRNSTWQYCCLEKYVKFFDKWWTIYCPHVNRTTVVVEFCYLK